MVKVCVNAGHHPKYDSGAVGMYSREADIVKFVAEVVCEDLRKVGIDALFVQEDNLAEICNKSNEYGADLFVSIHCNSAVNKKAEGTETFYYKGSHHSQLLAECVQHQLVDTMESVDRGIKEGNKLYVIRRTVAPAILTELGFISNAREEKYLNEHKKVMAHAIARGITDYLNVIM